MNGDNNNNQKWLHFLKKMQWARMLKVALEMGLKYKITKKYKKFQKSE